MAFPSDSRNSSAEFTSQDSAVSMSVNSTVPPPVPNPYDIKDPAAIKQIKKRIDERWKTANHRRWLFELTWLRNILFMLGIQWVRIDWPGREIRNLSLPTNFPRAITNKYAQVMGDLWSQLVQGEIPVNWMPSTEDPKDRSTAEICERLREVIDMETKVRPCKRDLGFWVTYAGNGFILPTYDYSPMNGTQPVPLSQCNGCGMTSKVGEMDGGGNPELAKPCPQCAAQSIPPQNPPYSPAVDPTTGQPMTTDVPIGRLKFDVLSPFEVYWDNIHRIGSPQHWFFRPHRYDVNEARAIFPDFAAKISEGMNEPMRPSRNYLIAIAYAGSYLTGTTGTGEASAREEMRRQVTAWEYWEDPTPEYPQGVYTVRLGEEIVELKPLPNKWGAGRLQGIPFMGLVHFHQEINGGAWAKSRANDLVSIQSRRNIIDSNLQLTAQRTGSPKLLNPMGSGLKNVTGEAGQIAEYKPISFGGTSLAKPEYLEAALGNVGPLVDLLKVLDDSQERIAGTFFLAGGNAPQGVTAASALAYLGEKSSQALSPLKEQWAEGWGTVYQYAIEIARAHWTDERVLAILGKNKQWQFQKFKMSDLTGSVNVTIDYEALFPKSDASIRADLMQLAQMGVITAGDPEQEYAILEKFGQTSLKQSQDDATTQAVREWDDFLTKGKPPQLIPVVQDSVAHLRQHKLDAMSQEFEALYATNQQQADIWIAHIIATQEDVAAQMMPPPGAALPGPPSPPPGHAGSQKGSQAGAASGNAKPAPIRKGEAAAQAEANLPPPPAPVGQ